MLFTNNKFPLYYIPVAVIVVLAKFAYAGATTTQLLFILSPTQTLISYITGANAVYILNQGFLFEDLKILIDKSCSGGNFWILSFFVFSVLFFKYVEKVFHKFLTILFVALFSFCFTIVVNTCRISASIIIQKQSAVFFEPSLQHLIHQGIGITTNLVFLIFSYYLIEQYLLKKYKHA